MYIGLDLGTSGIRALLMDADQRIIGSAEADLTVSRPHPGWSEQEPADWIRAAETAMAELRSLHPDEVAAVKGIGLSGQMHGATLLDADDQVLRPCILWNDTRSHEEAAALDADPRFRQISGNIVFPGFTAPKLVWVAKNEPETFKKVRKVLLPKDYLRLWLTGEHVAEMSDAAGTSWLDTGARKWSPELLDASGMSIDQMPRLVEGSDVSGQLRPDLAQEWGMGSVVVAGGAGDNAASAIGAGTISAGTGFVSLGTSGVLFAANDQYLPNPESAVHAFCHALPGRWHQMGVILTAASALNWFAGIVGSTPAALSDALGDTLIAPSGATFLPYLSGERTPHNDAAVRGSFAGLAHETDRDAMARAVMEGVAFALRDNLEALHAAGTDLQSIMAIGGGSRSHYWLKVIATALNLHIDIPAEGDFGAAFGAARLGLLAHTGADPVAVCHAPKIDGVIEPELALRDAFDAAYDRYRSLYVRG
ncbi:xylulokinase [Actibacterium lipolyticum]|uniref:Xylulose kinase n=1 Tax=Actibacterium lipolyticum TaxID=1524263 RepID=A0A238JXY3_9RHOB|nr:xylulokinase [Actibacterium lipolyticum]SMX34702.1 Xylulose kinase [Actibacterium lipolyticum]